MKTKQQRKDKALEEYYKITDSASKEYKKIRDPAWEEYDKIKATALKECKKKCEEIDNEFEEVIEHNGKRYKLINGN